MPGAINSAHVIFMLIAIGILVGLGAALAWRALSYPWSDTRIGGAAVIICALLLLVAWLV